MSDQTCNDSHHSINTKSRNCFLGGSTVSHNATCFSKRPPCLSLPSLFSSLGWRGMFFPSLGCTLTDPRWSLITLLMNVCRSHSGLVLFILCMSDVMQWLILSEPGRASHFLRSGSFFCCFSHLPKLHWISGPLFTLEMTACTVPCYKIWELLWYFVAVVLNQWSLTLLGGDPPLEKHCFLGIDLWNYKMSILDIWVCSECILHFCTNHNNTLTERHLLLSPVYLLWFLPGWRLLTWSPSHSGNPQGLSYLPHTTLHNTTHRQQLTQWTFDPQSHPLPCCSDSRSM